MSKLTKDKASKLLEAANAFGTPLYIYNEQKIIDQCKAVKDVFTDLPVHWLYAIKANDNPFIMETIRAMGIGFDTVSYEEVILCKEFTNTHSEIFYTENSMSDYEMDAAIKDGVVLNIGSLKRLERFCMHPESKRCCLRVNPAIGDGHHARVNTGDSESKFGVRIGLLREAAEMAVKHGKIIEGIHAHIGSGIKEPENLLAAMKVMLELSEEFPDLEYINFGGGMPTPYTASDAPFNMKRFAELASPVLRDDLSRRKPGFRYYFEPGRWFVAESGFLLCSVQTVKDQIETTYLGTDTGMHHLMRPIIYDAYHQVVNLSKFGQVADHRYTISGNICESGDILAFDRMMPRANMGDVLAICDAGAYGMTMASQYNRRALPAELMIRPDGSFKLIRPARSQEETVKDFLQDCGFTKQSTV
ncbi:MAG: diaminopimelate decarboxylase [Balneolales bacterium]|nr:diaminopimelate decarboxylase [Balneolales bacterium]